MESIENNSAEVDDTGEDKSPIEINGNDENESSVAIGDYEIDTQSIIGSGQFGTIYSGTNSSDNSPVAVKKVILACSDLIKSTDFDYEIERLKDLVHPNLLQVLDHKSGQTPENAEEKEEMEIWFITPHCPVGNLAQYFQSTKLDFSDIAVIGEQCAKGLAYLHNMKPCISHRNLKWGNILMVKEDGKLVAKISDFGIFNLIQSDTWTVSGGQHFMAPEIFGWNSYGCAVDVFSLGVIIGYILNAKRGQDLTDIDCTPLGRSMWKAKEQESRNIHMFEDVIKGNTKHDKLKKLVNSMTEFLPENRPDIEDVADQFKELHSPVTKMLQNVAQQITGNRKDSNASFGKIADPCLLSASKMCEISVSDDPKPCISSSGQVLIGRKKLFKPRGMLCKYELQDGSYKMVWDKLVPDGMSFECTKLITESGHVILSAMSEQSVKASNTHIYTEDLEIIAKHRVQGELLGTWGNRLLYVCYHYVIAGRVLDVYNRHCQHLFRIPLASGVTFKDLSCCTDPVSGSLMVLDCFQKMVDVYSDRGKKIKSLSILTTCNTGPLSSTINHALLFLTHKGLHVQKLEDGEHVDHLTKQELGVQDHEAVGMARFTSGNVLQTAIWDKKKKKYKKIVIYNSSEEASVLRQELAQEKELRGVTESCLMEDRMAWQHVQQIATDTRQRCAELSHLLKTIGQYQDELTRRFGAESPFSRSGSHNAERLAAALTARLQLEEKESNIPVEITKLPTQQIVRRIQKYYEDLVGMVGMVTSNADRLLGQEVDYTASMGASALS